MVIKITKRLKFKRCIGRNQVCILCERNMGQQTGLMIDSSCDCGKVERCRLVINDLLNKGERKLLIEVMQEEI